MTWYWISGVTLVLAALLALNLIDSHRPAAPCARIHDSEVAARVLGIDVARYKLIAFVLSAIYAAIAGAYLALFDGLVTPATAGFLRSIEFVTMAVLGGLGSILGSIVGAALLTVLAASADGVPRLRAYRARPDHDRVHDFSARRHRAEPCQPVPAGAVMSVLAAENLGIDFGGVKAVDGVSFSVDAGRDIRHHRPEWRRQDHAVQPDLRAVCADARQCAAERKGGHQSAGACAGAAGLVAHVSESADLLSHDRARECHGRLPSA